ncbi:Fc.00g085490.m01.CDS01 [Cosmosporella sp. VM-42]
MAHFGPLMDLAEVDLLSLAIKIRKDVLGTSTSQSTLISRVPGSYNINHIIKLDNFKLVIRVPASGRGANVGGNAASAMEMQVATLRFLEKKTTIPAPRVYNFDTASDNEIRAPYICMSYLEGECLEEAWFDDTREIPLEHRRLKTLDTLAQYMAQLAPFKFDKMGSLVESKSGVFSIGPCFEVKTINDDTDVKVTSIGPYDTWSEYVREKMEPTSEMDQTWAKGEEKVFKAMLSSLPCTDSSTDFVLVKPDPQARNVLVDNEGNVTGLLDWDYTITVPACFGFGTYPTFISPDWNPSSYFWPKMNPDGHEENDPDELDAYREYYNEALGKVLQKDDWKWTEKSHMREAVFLAVLDGKARLDICKKFVSEALELEDAGDELFFIGENHYSEEQWEELEFGLQQLILWADLESGI